MTTTLFKSPYRPATGFYSGTGSTELVPFIYPVAINGRAYMIDSRSGKFARQFDGRVRDSVDQSSEPGEAAINPQGLWRRSQSSWHLGANQIYSDTADAESFRFRSSKGLNVWDRGQLSMLKDTTQIVADATGNLLSMVVGNRLYVGSSGNIQFTTDLSGFTACTGEPAAQMNSMTTDGYNLFVSFAAQGIWKTDKGITTFAQYITGTDTFTVVRWTKGRLMAGRANALYNWLGTGSGSSGLLFTHANTDFVWVGFAGGQNAIYAAGYSGTTSLIYRMVLKADATALDSPIVAAELPNGEIVTSLDSYLGFILIGTTTGFRFASADVNGNLVVGGLVEVGSIAAFASQGRFVWFSYKNMDSISTGLGRMDISQQIVDNQPAWTSDLMVNAQGAIPSVGMFGTRPVFVVTGTGVYVEHATDKVISGTLDTGIYRWGIPDVKFIPKWDLRTKALKGTVQLWVSADGGAYASLGIQSVADSLISAFDGFEDRIFEAEAQLLLRRSDTDLTLGPTVTRWMARAYAAPARAQVFSVPILLHSKIQRRGREYFLDVSEELRLLRNLVDNARVVTYQENLDTYSVIIEDVLWEPLDTEDVHNISEWNGTATIIMRSVR